MPPTDLYLIRHAQSTWNAAGIWQGQADPPLSPHGARQARALAESFPTAGVTHVLSSDLERALHTAAPLAERLGIEVREHVDLREIDVGSWSGQTREQIRAEDAAALDAYFRGEEGWIGGERYAEHEERSTRVARELDTLDTDGAVIAVTHGGTLRAITRTLLEMPHTERWRMSGPSHASVTHLRRGAYGWRMLSFNAGLTLTHA